MTTMMTTQNSHRWQLESSLEGHEGVHLVEGERRLRAGPRPGRSKDAAEAPHRLRTARTTLPTSLGGPRHPGPIRPTGRP